MATATTIPELPEALGDALAGYTWTQNLDAGSGGAVFRLEAAGRPALYLKAGAGQVADDVTAEMARLVWLAGRLPAPYVVPAVRQFVRHQAADGTDSAYLVTTAVPGRTAYACLTDAARSPARQAAVVGALARFLRAVHALPLAECPFHVGHALRLAGTRREVAAGRVTPPEDAPADWDPAAVLAEAESLLPLPFERVVTHGDYSLGNVFLEDGDGRGEPRVTGCIDVGRLGAADPYQDFAILWENLEEFGDAAQRALWPAYGVAVPDPRRLRFHLLLDTLPDALP